MVYATIKYYIHLWERIQSGVEYFMGWSQTFDSRIVWANLQPQNWRLVDTNFGVGQLATL